MLDDESIALFRRTGAYYVPTLSTVNGYLERTRGRSERLLPRRCAPRSTGASRSPASRCARPSPRGVKIAFGTDAGVSKHGRNADEFELMVKYGMTPAAGDRGRHRQCRRPARPRGRSRHARARQACRPDRGRRRSARRRDGAEARAVRDEGRRGVQGRAGATRLLIACSQCTVRRCVEARRGRPVVRPGMRRAQRLGLVRVARDHVRVQRGLEVAEQRVVDAQGTGRLEHRLAEPRDVGQERGLCRAAPARSGAARPGPAAAGNSRRAPAGRPSPPSRSAGVRCRSDRCRRGRRRRGGGSRCSRARPRRGR